MSKRKTLDIPDSINNKDNNGIGNSVSNEHPVEDDNLSWYDKVVLGFESVSNISLQKVEAMAAYEVVNNIGPSFVKFAKEINDVTDGSLEWAKPTPPPTKPVKPIKYQDKNTDYGDGVDFGDPFVALGQAIDDFYPDNPVDKTVKDVKQNLENLENDVKNFYSNVIFYVEVAGIGLVAVGALTYGLWAAAEIKTIIR